jgi:hypothetical protein
MQAHRRLLLLDNRLRELSVVPWLRIGTAVRGSCFDPGDDAEIGQTIWTRSTPPRVRTGLGLQIVEQFGDITRHWPPVYHGYPGTPVTVPVIQTSSAQPAAPLARRKGTIADSTDLQSQASPLGEGAAPKRVGG